jgi:hypothetical protein
MISNAITNSFANTNISNIIHYNITNLSTILKFENLNSFNKDEIDLLRIVSQIFSGLSIAGLLFVQIVFWFLISKSNFAFELIAWLCSVNIIFNVTNFLPVYQEDTIQKYNDHQLSNTCTIQAILNIYSDLSSLIWTTLIGYTAYLSVTKKINLESNKIWYRVTFLSIAFLIPLAFSLM